MALIVAGDVIDVNGFKNRAVVFCLQLQTHLRTRRSNTKLARFE